MRPSTRALWFVVGALALAGPAAAGPRLDGDEPAPAFGAPANALAQSGEPLEIDILEGYLATYDLAPELPHCARRGGHLQAPGQPPIPLPTGGTNALMEEHTEWHLQHGGGPGDKPSTSDADRFGDHFVYWHREFLARYEVWRAANGYLAIPAWDPGTPMPPSLEYSFPGRGCSQGRSDDPQVTLPTWATLTGGDEEDPLFGHTALCDFADVNQLGKSISVEYHVAFHARVGGDMRLGNGPRDPAFWAGHRFIDGVAVTWETSCLGPEAFSTDGPPSAPREAPGASAALVLLGLVAAACIMRRSAGPGQGAPRHV